MEEIERGAAAALLTSNAVETTPEARIVAGWID